MLTKGTKVVTHDRNVSSAPQSLYYFFLSFCKRWGFRYYRVITGFP